MTPHYLADLGPVIQALQLSGLPLEESERETMRWMARDAGLQPGDRILDAGCGVCGPAIYLARELPDVTVEAITLSPVQRDIAATRIREAGLQERIQVQVADYHNAPFASGSFDAVLFFESACYSPNPVALYREALRLLRDGGTLYVKDPFRKEGELTEDEKRGIAQVDELYESRIRSIGEEEQAIARAGFAHVEVRNLDDLFDDIRYRKAMFEPGQLDNTAARSGLGEHHKLAYPPPLLGYRLRAVKA